MRLHFLHRAHQLVVRYDEEVISYKCKWTRTYTTKTEFKYGASNLQALVDKQDLKYRRKWDTV